MICQEEETYLIVLNEGTWTTDRETKREIISMLDACGMSTEIKEREIHVNGFHYGELFLKRSRQIKYLLKLGFLS